MIIRAAEGFLLHERRLPTVEDLNSLGVAELRGDPLVSCHPAMGECIGQYDGPELPKGWEFVKPAELPKELQPLLLLADAISDEEYFGSDLPTGFIESVEAQKARYP